MGHTPYGYRIEGGKATVDEAQAEIIRNIYKNYLLGDALEAAARNAGLETYHGTVRLILTNCHYIGDDFYPAIVDKATFDKAQKLIEKNARKKGRHKLKPRQPKYAIRTSFTVGQIAEKHADPKRQAEYIYGLIESEVTE